MKKISSLLLVGTFFILCISVHAETFENARVIISPWGEVPFELIRVEEVLLFSKRWEGTCGTDENKRKECEEVFSKKWLRMTPSNSPRVTIAVKDISSPSQYIPDYSLYISWPGPRGGMLIVGERQIFFSYYTINADATELVNIERFRGWLDEMARQKKRIRFSGTITRIETLDLELFADGKTETEFLDFYLSDIKFEK
ncbi:MAG: hypothetical protein Q7R73_04880 [bacterium]|nr:hypothetical protein [bacterium]